MKLKSLLFPIFLLVLFTSCKLDIKSDDNSAADTNEQIDDGVESITDAIKDIGEKMKGANNDKSDVELINWRDIKEQLPNRLLGMKQENIGGETVGAFGFNFSVAEATYVDGDSKIDISITDTGSMGAALLSMAAWSTLTVDKEDKYGYERTSTYKGHKIYEKYDKRNIRGEFNALIGERFVVSVDGKNIDSKSFQKIIDKIDIEDLL